MGRFSWGAQAREGEEGVEMSGGLAGGLGGGDDQVGDGAGVGDHRQV
jgi:hypothetical protein